MNKRIGGVALAFAAVAFFAAACGSSGDSANGGTPPSTGTDYASCLRNNGVNLPQSSARPTSFPSGRPSGRPTTMPSGSFSGGPGGGGGPGGMRGGGGIFGSTAPEGVDQATWEKAQKACASLRPTGFPGGGNGGGPGNGGGGRDAAYRNCLTERGVTVSGPLDQLDASDAKVAAAVTACAPLKPNARPSAS